MLHNTFVDNRSQVRGSARPFSNAAFENNIFLSISSGTDDTKNPQFNGASWEANYWSQGSPGERLADNDDVYSGIQLRRMAGWHDIWQLSDVSADDFRPLATSATNSAGTWSPQLTADFNGRSRTNPPDLGALVSGEKPITVGRPRSPSNVRLIF